MIEFIIILLHIAFAVTTLVMLLGLDSVFRAEYLINLKAFLKWVVAWLMAGSAVYVHHFGGGF